MEVFSSNFLLSIITPVYNAAPFLEAYFESVIGQQAVSPFFEIIIVDDGSTDTSNVILGDYASRYSYIKVIHQDNQGVSTARNLAISLAKGKYVTFIDADDQIYPDTLCTIMKYIVDNDLDIVYPQIDVYSECHELLDVAVGSMLINKVEIGLIHERRTFAATFYRKKLFENNLFPIHISFGEDTVVNFRAQFFAKKVAYLDIPYYKYTDTKNSLSKQGKTDKSFFGMLDAIKEIVQFELDFSKKTKEENIYFNKVYNVFINRILELNILPTFDKLKYHELKELMKQSDKLDLIKLQDKKYPYFSKSFIKFKYYQNYLQFKSEIYNIFIRK